MLVLTDPEGAPLAAVDAVDVWPTREGWCGVGGPVRRIGDSTHGSFRRLRLAPDEITPMLPPGRVLGVIADRPLHRPQLAQIAYAARTIAGHVLIIVPVGRRRARTASRPEALIRTVFAARDRMPPATIVAVPLARRGDDIADALLRARGSPRTTARPTCSPPAREMSGGGPRALLPRELAYDGRDGQWRGADDIPPRHRRVALTADEIDGLLDRGRAAAGVAHAAGGGPGAGPGPPAAAGPRAGRLLHRAVRLGQVDDRPRRRRRAGRDRRAQRSPSSTATWPAGS